MPAWGRIWMDGANDSGHFAVVYILSMIVRYAMKPLDLGELERMKYKYKGA